MKRRRGFALHVVLWIILVAGSVALVASVAGHDAFDAAGNRLAMERAHWSAVECAERMRATADSVLGTALDFNIAAQAWRRLGATLDSTSLPRELRCAVRVEAAGTRLNINVATAEALSSILTSAALPPSFADSIIARRARVPFADARELRHLAPILDSPRLRELVGTEPGRVSINTAEREVLLAVPGLSDEIIDAILEIRRRGEEITDVLTLSSRVSATAAAAMLSRYPDLVRATTTEPEAWIVTATAFAPNSAAPASVEQRLVRVDRRATVARLRSWP